MFSLCPEPLCRLTVVCYPWKKTGCTPILTGVPPHVLLMAYMKRFESKIDDLHSEMMNGMKEELNERDIGGGMYHAKRICEEIRALCESLNRIWTKTSSSRDGNSNDAGPVGQRRTSLHAYNSRFFPKIFKSRL